MLDMEQYFELEKKTEEEIINLLVKFLYNPNE